jgi:hypothetical protein
MLRAARLGATTPREASARLAERITAIDILCGGLLCHPVTWNVRLSCQRARVVLLL